MKPFNLQTWTHILSIENIGNRRFIIQRDNIHCIQFVKVQGP